VVEAVLEGIERECPEWTELLQGLQGGLTGRETIADIQPDLARLEVKLRKTADSGHRAVAMRANAAGSQTSDQQALEARVEQLSAQL
jgi:glycerol kinase